MIDRLEVVAGPGTVIRYGSVVAWAAASASANLVSFLAESARNLAPSPAGGEQLADHLAGVLSRRDPEPHVPFVVIGPAREGWTALLHGPVQLWDGASWISARPDPGWLRTPVSPRPALAVSLSGNRVPAPSPDSVMDLEAGVVPGGGFLLQPAGAAPPPPPVGVSVPVPAEETTLIPPPETGMPTVVLEPAPAAGVASPEAAETISPEAAGIASPEAAAEATTGQTGAPAEEATAGQSDAPAEEATAAQSGAPAEEATAGQSGAPGQDSRAPAGVVDLRSGPSRSRVVAYPPLPPAGDPPRPVPGAPVVAGVPCPQGHLNRPRMSSCARCGRPIAAGAGYQVSGTRPALGCLITDEGSVYRLDSGYLVGSDPTRDPTVRGRLARPLSLPGRDVAGTHAEIRLHDWDVVVTDRASDGGTYVFEPGASAWERLRPYDPRVLPPGTHLAFGQRVATFVTPWTLHEAAGSADQETSERYWGQ